MFPAWMIYIEDKTRKIAEAFSFTEKEKRALLSFGDIMNNLLQRAHEQAKAKLASIYDDRRRQLQARGGQALRPRRGVDARGRGAPHRNRRRRRRSVFPKHIEASM